MTILAQVSQTLQSSYFSHVIVAAMQTDECWHLHCSDCTNMQIYTHKTSRALPTCSISLRLANVTSA